MSVVPVVRSKAEPDWGQTMVPSLRVPSSRGALMKGLAHAHTPSTGQRNGKIDAWDIGGGDFPSLMPSRLFVGCVCGVPASGGAVNAAVVVGHQQQRQAVRVDGDQVTGGDVRGRQHGHPLLLHTHNRGPVPRVRGARKDKMKRGGVL